MSPGIASNTCPQSTHQTIAEIADDSPASSFLSLDLWSPVCREPDEEVGRTETFVAQTWTCRRPASELSKSDAPDCCVGKSCL